MLQIKRATIGCDVCEATARVLCANATPLKGRPMMTTGAVVASVTIYFPRDWYLLTDGRILCGVCYRFRSQHLDVLEA